MTLSLIRNNETRLESRFLLKKKFYSWSQEERIVFAVPFLILDVRSQGVFSIFKTFLILCKILTIKKFELSLLKFFEPQSQHWLLEECV